MNSIRNQASWSWIESFSVLFIIPLTTDSFPKPTATIRTPWISSLFAAFKSSPCAWLKLKLLELWEWSIRMKKMTRLSQLPLMICQSTSIMTLMIFPATCCNKFTDFLRITKNCRTKKSRSNPSKTEFTLKKLSKTQLIFTGNPSQKVFNWSHNNDDQLNTKLIVHILHLEWICLK